MGFENSLFPALRNQEGPTMAERWAKEDAEQKAAELRMIENARADAKAVWALAEYSMPADVKEMAERFKMPETLQEMWRGAFIEGWRAANRQPRS